MQAEPVAEIPPDEAALVCEERWASWVESRVQDRPGRQVSLLTFSRHPQELADMINSSELARSAVARGLDMRPAWAGGATVLVDGVGAQDFKETLKPYHVVIDPRDEDAFMMSLQHLPYNSRKLRGNAVSIPVATAIDEFSLVGFSASSSDVLGSPILLQSGAAVTVSRTFLHVEEHFDFSWRGEDARPSTW